MYLDEVSVYSLLASRSGPVPTEFTSTESESLKGEVSGGVVVTGGVAKGEAKSRVESDRTSGSQVVRKSSAQARFKQLLDGEQSGLVLHAEGAKSPTPSVGSLSSLTDLDEVMADPAQSRSVLDPSRLKRGQLLEIEVELEAEEVYRVSQTLTALLDIVEQDPELFGLTDREGLREGGALVRVLEQLLVGLVPIRGRATRYRVVERADRTLLVHEDVLAQLDVVSEPLWVVGVAESSLFWKDVRRVLFAHNRYVALCRLGQNGLHDDWSPIKLVDVLKDVVPEIAAQLDDAGRGLLAAMRTPGGDQQVAATVRSQLNAALIAYAYELAHACGGTIERADIDQAGLLLDASAEPPDSVEGRRDLFAPVTALVEQRVGSSVDRTVAAQLRGAALLESGALGLTSGDQPFASLAPSLEGRCLHSEFIAIYW